MQSASPKKGPYILVEFAGTRKAILKETLRTYAPVGSQSWAAAKGNRGNVHTADNEGRRLTQEQAAKLQRSSIVDQNGAPLAVYHSTDNMDFTTFEKGDTGFHFGTKDQASRLANQRGHKNGRTFRVYLDIKNRTNLPAILWGGILRIPRCFCGLMVF